jgi:hypothetical protein
VRQLFLTGQLQSLDPHHARCARPQNAPMGYYVDAGYGDDTVSLAGAFNGAEPSAAQVTIDGGAGNDPLNGSSEALAPATFNGNTGAMAGSTVV